LPKSAPADAGGADTAAPAAPNPPATDAGEDAGTTSEEGGTPTPVPTGTTPPPPPPPPPVGWHSVVGGGGFFGQTFDGVTWAGRSIAPVALYGVACADNAHGWAAGEHGYVAYTSNGGQTWAVQAPHLTSDLRAISFGWSTHGVVAGDDGALAVTQDSGAHWSVVAPLTTVALRGAAVAPYVNVMLAVGDGGTVLRSADMGETWTRTTLAGAGDLRGVTSDAWAGTVLAVDSLGTIWSSPDEGVTFAREASAGVALDSVSTPEAGSRAVAVGAGGVVLLRAAGGAWSRLSTGSSANLHAALVSVGGSRITVAGEAGTLLSSTDLGGHWTAVPLGTTAALYGLQDL
jgi:photosystem II stability/assembly factor-like uncharacterized protein